MARPKPKRLTVNEAEEAINKAAARFVDVYRTEALRFKHFAVDLMPTVAHLPANKINAIMAAAGERMQAAGAELEKDITRGET
jgi:hypothetical protein